MHTFRSSDLLNPMNTDMKASMKKSFSGCNGNWQITTTNGIYFDFFLFKKLIFIENY